jgi:hypothetical protein
MYNIYIYYIYIYIRDRDREGGHDLFATLGWVRERERSPSVAIFGPNVDEHGRYNPHQAEFQS